MDFSVTTVAALFLLFAAASCAPVELSLQDACVAVRNSSLELNQIAKMISLKVPNEDKVMNNFSTSLLWMEAKDMCDPGNLKQKTGPCIGKILDVLKKYNSTVYTVAQFESCSEFEIHKVKSALLKLQKDVSRCVKSWGAMDHHQESNISEEETRPIRRWEQPHLCHYTIDRLFSFSILTARVFAVGDPAHHAESPAQRCM